MDIAMRIASILTLIAALSTSNAFAQANQGVGFATVKEALDTLKSRKTATVTQQGGWVIVNELAESTIWSFTPANHPAHPSVVKRTIVKNNDQLGVEMSALCEAQKTACDSLMAEFTQLNNQMASEVQKGSSASVSFVEQVAGSNKDTNWRPVVTDAALLEKNSVNYFITKDAGKYQDAYLMYDAVFRQTTSFDQWRLLASETSTKLGSVSQRTIKRLVWYKDPASAAPGVYAAMDFAGISANANIYCGYIVWKQQADATFALVREEQNIIDKITQNKLSPSELEKARIQIGC
jgi:Protein of unknown function (DUF4019)